MAVLFKKINLDHLQHNFQFFLKQSPKIAAVVKADAYGLGVDIVVPFLFKQGCHDFFVANATEGKTLRNLLGNDVNIYVFDGLIEIDLIKKYDLIPVLNNFEQIETYKNYGLTCQTVLHIDTGMNRLGIPYFEAHKLSPQDLSDCNIMSLMTHFIDSEDNLDLTHQQAKRFFDIKDRLQCSEYSLNNSAGFLNHNFNNPHNMSRIGIALYGGFDHSDLKPVVSVYGKILQRKHVKASETVGYGASHKLTKDSKIITVAGGYADGILRSLSNTAYCGWVDGYDVPLIGRVSMDTTIFDASELPDDIYEQAEMLEFFGEHNSIFNIANHAGTISYEILTSLSKRAELVIKP